MGASERRRIDEPDFEGCDRLIDAVPSRPRCLRFVCLKFMTFMMPLSMATSCWFVE
jgi:hypothetical protein